MKPLIIGRYQRPRCFIGVDLKCLPCTYVHSKNAWMTSAIFQNWLLEINQRMLIQRRNILLFVDNAPCHRVTAKLSNIRIEFLPPNCTSVAQPLDQAVIWSFKCKFRKMLLDYVISGIESDLQDKMAANIQILQAIHLTKRAWDEVHPDTVVNSFCKAGFLMGPLVPVIEETDCDLVENFLDYVSADERLFNQEVEQIDYDNEEVSCDWFYLRFKNLIALGPTNR